MDVYQQLRDLYYNIVYQQIDNYVIVYTIIYA